jgi:hypothetical protein
MSRVVCWFSAGAPSAVAAKLALAEYGHDRTVVAYINPGSEHTDNHRFVSDCAGWFNHEVLWLRSRRYKDTWQVWEQRRFLVGPTGALCTAELKKRVRFEYQRPDDIQIFGYTGEETGRAERFREQNPGVDLRCPLIERGLTKNDCLAMVERAGLVLPLMYRLGFHNANCVGCVKGGMGYWNKIRVHFPETFARMARLEREIGHAIQKDENGPVWLDELDPGRGDYPNEPAADCSLLCAIAEEQIA